MSLIEKIKAHKVFATLIIMVVVALAIYAIFPKDIYSIEVNGFDERWPMGSDNIDKTGSASSSTIYPLVDFQYNGANYSTRTDSSFLPVDTEYVAFDILVSNSKGGEVFQRAFPEENAIIYIIATPYKVFYAKEEIAISRENFHSSKITENSNGKFVVTYEPDMILASIIWLVAVAIFWLIFVVDWKKC